ncbi:MAG: hypothetical protein ACRD3P_04335 [Terriglobales bacterium]
MSTILWVVILTITLLHASGPLNAEAIRVHHVEGVTFGFLVLRDLDGKTIAHGYLKQVVTPGEPVVIDDLQFHFKDGSSYREITKFTERGTFRLVSDQVTQKGPSFKQESESLLDVAKGKVTVKTVEKGKEKTATKQLAMPGDVSNGMLFILAKNMNPSAPETVVSMVALTDKPRVVQLRFTPSTEKPVTFGPFTFKAQHYVMKVKIEGAAGKIAPLIGKQPPDSHFFVVKSESPTFYEFEGPMFADGPVWRMELGAPEPETGIGKASEVVPDKNANPR